MIALKSVFDLQEFVLLRNEYEFRAPEKGNVVVNHIISKYIIDIDYTIKAKNKDNLEFQVFVKIGINNDFIQPGYALFIEGVGFFKFEKSSELSDDEKLIFLQSSGISICINCLRSLIGGLTAYGPFGKYLLPSIDVNDLVNQKIAKMSENIKKKKSVPKLK